MGENIQLLDYREKRVAIEVEPSDYVLSDGKPDRHGDVIDPDGWMLGRFATPALFNHNRDFIIGKWEKPHVDDGQLIARLVLAEPGTSPIVDTVHALIEQRLLETVSVGFRPLDRKPVDPKDPFGPQTYTKTELLEASLVSIAANPRARRIAKQFGLSDDETERVFAFPTAKPAASSPPRPFKGNAMNALPLGKRIEQAETNLVALRDSLAALDKTIAEQDAPSEEQSIEVEALGGEIETAQRTITTLRSIETRLATQAANNLPAVITAAPAIIDKSKVQALGRKVGNPRELLFRAMTCQLIAKVYGTQGKAVNPFEVLQERYGSDEAIGIVLKAAMQPASTTVVGWAAELVGTTIADFMENLPREAIYPQLASRGPKFTFSQNGIIKVPSRSATPKVNGSFVGEGQPIPVRRLGTVAITLTPKKMAVISEFTQELQITSTPSIESVIRAAIQEDTAEAIDTVLIDDIAADVVRPAGLRFGVAGLPVSALPTPFEKMVADIRALVGTITAARGGRALVLIMNPAQAMALQWVVVNGIFVFDSIRNGDLRGITVVSSVTVPAGMMICVDAADFASVTADQPEFNVSDVATIHEEDTAPLPISATGAPATVAAPVRSLWQTYSIGIRMILPMNWAMRRAGMVAWMTGVTW